MSVAEFKYAGSRREERGRKEGGRGRGGEGKWQGRGGEREQEWQEWRGERTGKEEWREGKGRKIFKPYKIALTSIVCPARHVTAAPFCSVEA